VAKKKKIKFEENIAKSFEEADDFNRKFWLKAGAFARFASAWQMILDYHSKIKGKRGNLPRLRRSVQNVQFSRH
jgi:hypothetical protein